MNRIFAALALCLAFLGNANATTTLQFSLSPNGATNFANSSGVATNGMLWGVVIDSSGNGFSSTAYDSFNSNSSGFLSTGGSATDDYYFFTNTSTQSAGLPFFSGVEAGNGAITTANNVPTTGDGVSGVASGDAFALIWFESSTANNGNRYGMFTNPAFTLQASGIVNYSAVFTGSDPIRSANLTIGGAGPIPEPSRVMLLGFGLAGLFFRRRR